MIAAVVRFLHVIIIIIIIIIIIFLNPIGNYSKEKFSPNAAFFLATGTQ